MSEQACILCGKRTLHQHRVCECGDWWEQHNDGADDKGAIAHAGPCRVCRYAPAGCPTCPCPAFRFHYMETAQYVDLAPDYEPHYSHAPRPTP